jgi:hypothetical protein
MVCADVMHQVGIEHELLAHITQAVRGTLAWGQEGEGLARKLATVRFVAHSFQRHLEHLLALEERDGFMDALVELHPHLASRIEALKAQHDGFREALQRIIPRLERLSPADHVEFAAISDDLRALLDRLDEHCLEETYLIHECQ